MDLSYKLKPQEERIGLWKDRYTEIKICKNPDCKNPFRGRIAYWDGHTLVRSTSEHQRLYCSKECKQKAILKRRRERYLNRDKSKVWHYRSPEENKRYYEEHREEISIKRKIKWHRDQMAKKTEQELINQFLEAIDELNIRGIKWEQNQEVMQILNNFTT